MKDYSNAPIVEVINDYFSTFELLSISLAELALGFAYDENWIYSEHLERDDFFLVGTDTLKKRIANELLDNPDRNTILQKYIEYKGKEVQEALNTASRLASKHKALPFLIRKSYFNGATRKVQFLEKVFSLFFYVKDEIGNEPVSATIGHFYDTIVKEFEADYNSIMGLFGTSKPKTAKQPPPTIPDNILQQLEQERLITKNPLKWIGAKNLCAYFVDGYFKNTTNKWKIGEELFGVDNLAQLKDLYLNKKTTDKPKSYEVIDRILNRQK